MVDATLRDPECKTLSVGTAVSAAHNGAGQRIQPMLYIEANGARIPAIGLGTWELRGRTCARVVEQALRLGYRHVDTAEMCPTCGGSGKINATILLTDDDWPPKSICRRR